MGEMTVGGKKNKLFFRNRDYSQFVCLMECDLVKKLILSL